MNLTLTRTEFREDGIFSVLKDVNGAKVADTLEHAYVETASTYGPKIPNGVYVCKRGMHRLHGMVQDFETFEITGVAGHENLLFHWGNYNADSEGCVLLGATRAESERGGMVTSSRVTFAKFMEMQKGVDQFSLIVK